MHRLFAFVGCLTPEALAMRGTIPPERGVEWFRTGFLPTVGQEVDFGWDPYSIAWVQVRAGTERVTQMRGYVDAWEGKSYIELLRVSLESAYFGWVPYSFACMQERGTLPWLVDLAVGFGCAVMVDAGACKVT